MASVGAFARHSGQRGGSWTRSFLLVSLCSVVRKRSEIVPVVALLLWGDTNAPRTACLQADRVLWEVIRHIPRIALPGRVERILFLILVSGLS